MASCILNLVECPQSLKWRKFAKDVEVRFNLDSKSTKGEDDVEYRLVESKQEVYWRG